MAEPELKSARFRREREADWRRLEDLLRRLERQPLSKLGEDDLLAIPVLYRASLSALSVARETSLDRALLDYLEGLCARAYFVVYGARPALGDRFRRFLLHDWPAAARALWRETLLAAGLLVLGAVVAAWLYRSDPQLVLCLHPRPAGRRTGAGRIGADAPLGSLQHGRGGTSWAPSPPSCSPTTPRCRCWPSRSASPSARPRRC